VISDIIHSVETALLNFSADTFDALGWWGVIALMALESTAVPIPAEVIMPLAGWRLIADQGLGVGYVFLAGLIGAIGSVIGSLVEYYISMAGGRRLIENYGKYILVTRKDMERAESWFANRGEITIFIGRMIPGVRHFISIPAGIARMNVVKFSLFTFLGALPWSLGLAWGGYLLGQNYEDIRQVAQPLEVPIILAIVIVIAWVLWRRVREVRREGAELRRAAESPEAEAD
jgi:membrane protein DedA with SNARE-associated domain